MSLSSEDCGDKRSSCTLEGAEGERFCDSGCRWALREALGAWPGEGEAAAAGVDPALRGAPGCAAERGGSLDVVPWSIACTGTPYSAAERGGRGPLGAAVSAAAAGDACVPARGGWWLLIPMSAGGGGPR